MISKNVLRNAIFVCLLAASVSVHADITSIEATGTSQILLNGSTFSNATKSYSNKLFGLESPPENYGEHSFRVQQDYSGISYVSHTLDGHLQYYSSTYNYGFAADFTNPGAQALWQSHIDAHDFSSDISNLLLATVPIPDGFICALYSLCGNSKQIETLPSGQLGSMFNNGPRDTNYAQLQFSGSLGFDSDISAISGILFNGLRQELLVDNYNSRDSGLDGSATEADYAAYAADNFISNIDTDLIFDWNGNSPFGIGSPYYDFTATMTFWFSEAAADQAMADIVAATTGLMVIWDNNIGFFSNIENPTSTLTFGSIAPTSNVPEPSVLALLALGLIGIGATRRKFI